MTVLAIKLSAHNNGVSKLHGDVVKNDVEADLAWSAGGRDSDYAHHQRRPFPQFSQRRTQELLDRYFGPVSTTNRPIRRSGTEWTASPTKRSGGPTKFEKTNWCLFAETPRTSLRHRGASQAKMLYADEVLSPYTFTISFARRFATYKRATLLFRDPDRLRRLLTNPDRPVQIIFAGKAHPHDIPGKNLIKDIVHFASDPEIRSKIVFLENYDLEIAKHLVSGSDIWLNTPRRPMEASGTSGMKAAINGVLNCSILDGWWDEGTTPKLALQSAPVKNTPTKRFRTRSRASSCTTCSNGRLSLPITSAVVTACRGSGFAG